jgi:MFS family permease
MKKHVTLLKKNGIFKTLIFVQFLNFTGGWLTTTAIFTLLVQLGASPFWIGLIGAAHFLAGIFQAPFTGVITDRVAPKKLFITIILVEIFSTALLLFTDTPELIPAIFILVLIRMGSASLYFNLKMVVFPKIVERDELQTANEISALSWSFTYILGNALSGLGVAFFGVTPVIVADIGLYLVSFLIMVNLKLVLEGSKSSEKFLEMFLSGFSYLFRNRKILHLIALHSFVGLATYEVIITLASQHYFYTAVPVAIGIGFTHAVRAFAIFLGPLIFGKFKIEKVLPYLFLFQGISLFLWSFTIENFYTNLIGSFLSGVVIGSIWSGTFTLLQKETDQRFYGRVIAYNDMLFLTVSVFTSIFSGQLFSLGVSLEVMLVGIGLLFILGFFYSRWILKN